MTNLPAVGARIEGALDELRANTDGRVWSMVQEAIALVTDLYGAGLDRMMELAGEDLRDRLGSDELVGSLLVLHGLHPLSLEERVQAALVDVRPYLGSHGGDVQVVGIDEAHGVLRIRMLGSCDGCPSSSVTLEMAVRQAIDKVAPEIAEIEVVDDRPPATLTVSTPVRLGPKPVAAR